MTRTQWMRCGEFLLTLLSALNTELNFRRIFLTIKAAIISSAVYYFIYLNVAFSTNAAQFTNSPKKHEFFVHIHCMLLRIAFAVHQHQQVVWALWCSKWFTHADYVCGWQQKRRQLHVTHKKRVLWSTLEDADSFQVSCRLLICMWCAPAASVCVEEKNINLSHISRSRLCDAERRAGCSTFHITRSTKSSPNEIDSIVKYTARRLSTY